MATLSKAENAAALRKAGIQRKSFSRAELCARNDISPEFYKKLQRLGLGPRETQILDRFVITVEDEAAWLQKLQKNAASKTKAEA
ncbi:hypothetical protein ABIG06_004715 [Bradyrhizobium sp. USDA 326]|uniref:hypothetical protein n=1 Tax=unclassified Bradyrhizobium TaxID=2631580 RepID=UPI000F523C92|nr:hypothetical protein [Bradyrhizobium sp. RP6]RQH09390.1 hypothetical protein EHH60_24990 [Bradyrhizobium sp. RP6]